MKLTVFGASGGTGRELVRRAADAGHEVTAVVRDAGRLPADLLDRIAVVEADLADPAAVEKAVLGRDAVISTIGTRELKHPTTVCADAARALTTAVHAAARPGADSTGRLGVRLVIASNSAMAPGPGDDPFTRFVVKPLILARVLRHMLDDMRRAEDHVRASDTAWTIVRAGRLTNHPAKGRYRGRVDRNVPGGFQITRSDFAAALLDAAINPSSTGHTISVAN
ncbi:MAG: NAD(P)H-binding protein [Streptomycetaceae bacterium]|nr:NAD(P)H-binding protein [Streptomycetaceae bacterium]